MPHQNNRSRHHDPSKKFGPSGNRGSKAGFSKPGNRNNSFSSDRRSSAGSFEKKSGESKSERFEKDSFPKKPFGQTRQFDHFEKRKPSTEHNKFAKNDRFKRNDSDKPAFKRKDSTFDSFSNRDPKNPRNNERNVKDGKRDFQSKYSGSKKEFDNKRSDSDRRNTPDRRNNSDRRNTPDRRNNSDRRDNPYKEQRFSDHKEKTFRTRPKSNKIFEAEDDGMIRLNRFISNSGICSRRKADELIAAGVISINNEVVTELGTKVNPATDDVRYNGERLKREKMTYILLNKPKDFITTTDDPQERKTVMQLVAKATHERIYPIGRLDRNTTGLLLLTNDGNLSEKLSHPRNEITKIYHVELDKNLTQGDFNKIEFGLELEDGFIRPDDISFVQGGSKREVGVKIHSGKNRIVRRIFEHLGYEVVKLDRVVYATLTKKDLPRGHWRFLTEKEIVQLKHLV